MNESGHPKAQEFASTGGATEAQSAHVVLKGSLQIREIEAVRDRFLAALQAEGPVTVDVTGLGGIDTAGVQLLLALRLESARRGRRFGIAGSSPTLDLATQLLGLREELFGDSTDGS
ncbi:MAG: STAS domain-containing protein [Gammaproteobacteria bacterium]|nr:STAS domain-containing protein [Gammaproteobacteria bacterium]